MIVTTGADKSYEPALDMLESQCERMGYRTRVYDLGGLGRGVPVHVESFDGWQFKPGMILDALEHAHEPMAYLDADIMPREPFDDIFAQRFDIAVTVRDVAELANKSPDSRRFLGWTNAGVLFFRPTPAARLFVDQWAELTDLRESDQHALNEMLYPDNKHPGFASTFTRMGAKVFTVPGNVWNCTAADSMTRKGVRLAHLTGGKWRGREAELQRTVTP